MMNNPLVSIILATYNRAHLIEESLLSIQNQTFIDWECLIIDDGSTDETKEVVDQFVKYDKRFKYFKRSGQYLKGLPGSRNCGLDLSHGEYIQFFDDDDYVHPKNLETTVSILDHNNIDFCHFQKHAYSGELPEIKYQEPYIVRTIAKAHILEVVTNKMGLASCTVLWRASCFKKQRFNEKLMYSEEWELYIRMLAVNDLIGVKIGNILYYNRKHDLSNTGEFQNYNPIRRASKVDAILIVIKTLKESQLLTDEIINHFIEYSVKFKEFGLFSKIITLLELKIPIWSKFNLIYIKYFLTRKLYDFKHQLKKILNYS